MINSESNLKDFIPKVRFAVFSDVHTRKNADCVQLERLKTGLEDAYYFARSNKKYKKLDALFFDGDFVDSGAEEEFENFTEVIKNHVDKNETSVVCNMASHEYGAEGKEKAEEKLRRYLKQEPNRHLKINGFHFISVSCENHCRFSDVQFDFARKYLDEAFEENPKKPIFFFQHPHITGTVYGSVLWGDEDFYPILMNYPQVVDFSGHSHAPINDPRSIYQKYFTLHGTGTLSHLAQDEFDKEGGIHPSDNKTAAQFLIVEADENGKTVIYPYDIITRKVFDCGPRVIERPWDISSYIYTDERYKNPETPYFDDGEKINVEKTENGIKVSFKQAKSKSERINFYIVTVKRVEDNAVVRRISFWSDYYLNDMPETVEKDITLGKNIKGKLIVEAEAEGFWHNVSSDKLSAETEI